MDSRKDQLQKQIIEALKANDNDLYSLLKSQWAHRFGVESLEELNNVDLSKLNQNLTILNNQKIDPSQENSFDSDKTISMAEDDNQEEEIKIKEVKSPISGDNQSSVVKSYENINKEKNKYPKVETLIPLPPKPKYSYLSKWLLRI